MVARLGPLLREDLAPGARFLRSLPAFLRHPIGPEQARAIFCRRLARREATFLALARRAVYPNAASPYCQLLRLAGCQYGDLERLVTRDGVEGALRTLYRHGVYLTVDEFKGRRPTIRGSATLLLDPSRLRNPIAASQVPVQSGGSRSAGTPLMLDLRFVRDRAVDICLALDARGGGAWLPAFWLVPGGGVTVHVLEFSHFGARPVRWFSQVDPAAPGLHPRYRWSARALRWGGRLAGVRLPRPQYVSIERPLPIARWMVEVLRAGRTPNLWTFASSAVRLCQAALDAGLDLRGAQLSVGGEPLTAARLAQIRRTGAEVVPRYGIVECGEIGFGCLAPEVPDDSHLLHDLHAMIQPGPDPPKGLPPDALLISSIRPTAPLILLNVAMGDQATLAERACGCPLERLGWTRHLSAIHSYEKLTAGGMTFSDRDVVRVLEVVLPARFGGGPADYQLVEEEADDGRPRLRLLVHPSIGPLDEAAVADAFLAAIGAGSGAERLMALLWRDAGLPRVERRAPRVTAAGKVLHLHPDRRPAEPTARYAT